MLKKMEAFPVNFAKKVSLIAVLGTSMLIPAYGVGMSYVQTVGNKMVSGIASFNTFISSGSFGERLFKSRCAQLVKNAVPGLSIATRLGTYAAILTQEWTRPQVPQARVAQHNVAQQKMAASKKQHKGKHKILQPAQQPIKAQPSSWKQKMPRAAKTLARLIICDEASSALSSRILKPLRGATNSMFGLNKHNYAQASFLKKALHFTVSETLDEIVGKHASLIAIISYSILGDLVANYVGY